MDVKYLFFNLLILFSIFIIPTYAEDESECIYGIFVKTGSGPDAGTQSNVSLVLIPNSGPEIVIRNLKDWGLTGQNSSFFQTGKQDLFMGKGPCLDEPPCGIGLSLGSDQPDPFDKWYCEYVEVGIIDTKKSCGQQHFKVKQWLGKDDFIAILDKCNSQKWVGDHFRISMVTPN